jgi:hypothetical protein
VIGALLVPGGLAGPQRLPLGRLALCLRTLAILGAALAYGIVQSRRSSARKRQQRDEATRDLYHRQR